MLMICTVIFGMVFTAPAKWRVELRAKTGQYRNRCLPYRKAEIPVYMHVITVSIRTFLRYTCHVVMTSLPRSYPYQHTFICTFYMVFIFHHQEKKEEKLLSSMIKPPPLQKIQKGNVKAQKRHHKLRLHNVCGPT